jgi:hypothetical protein
MTFVNRSFLRLHGHGSAQYLSLEMWSRHHTSGQRGRCEAILDEEVAPP